LVTQRVDGSKLLVGKTIAPEPLVVVAEAGPLVTQGQQQPALAVEPAVGWEVALDNVLQLLPRSIDPLPARPPYVRYRDRVGALIHEYQIAA
jgi:hypothetical protein